MLRERPVQLHLDLLEGNWKVRHVILDWATRRQARTAVWGVCAPRGRKHILVPTIGGKWGRMLLLLMLANEIEVTVNRWGGTGHRAAGGGTSIPCIAARGEGPEQLMLIGTVERSVITYVASTAAAAACSSIIL